MSEAYVLFVAALLMATVLVTIACASIGRSNHARYRWLAKLCRGLGFAVLGVGSLVVGSGIILTVAAGAAPGVAELDRTQLLRNGLYRGALQCLRCLARGDPSAVRRKALVARSIAWMGVSAWGIGFGGAG
jgi:hypothetical protein